jgi:predicted nucleic acid-binding protein
MTMKHLYLDVCCLCRPFDDQSQKRIKAEADAIKTILDRCLHGFYALAGSPAIEIELKRITNPVRLANVMSYYSFHGLCLAMNAQVKMRSVELQRLGLRHFDSLHLALAEVHGQDALLTTDDDFIKKRTASM